MSALREVQVRHECENEAVSRYLSTGALVGCVCSEAFCKFENIIKIAKLSFKNYSKMSTATEVTHHVHWFSLKVLLRGFRFLTTANF